MTPILVSMRMGKEDVLGRIAPRPPRPKTVSYNLSAMYLFSKDGYLQGYMYSYPHHVSSLDGPGEYQWASKRCHPQRLCCCPGPKH
jgi:hypothetical protein